MRQVFTKKMSIMLLFLLQFFCHTTLVAASSKSFLLKEMFTKVTLDKNDKAIPIYYDKNFVMYSNGKKMNYKEFLLMHQGIYKTPIKYKIKYDDKSFVEQGNKVAGRLFITTKRPGHPAREIEVILIAEYKANKLLKLWELTYPDWSKMRAFQKVIKAN